MASGVKTVKATINGQVYTLTLNNTTGKYETTVTAPTISSYNNNDGHYYPVQITAEDVAGNTTTVSDSDTTLGGKLKLVVKEKVAPVIAITYPTASATLISNKPTITWKVTDTDSGVNTATIGITIDSGSKITSGITKTAITGGYSCSYIPTTALADGSHTLKFDATDNDGNVATQKSVAFKVDTIPPTLVINTPTDNLVTNNSTLSVSGTTNDITSSPVTVNVNGTNITVNANGTFSTTITLSEGENTITIVATDSAGKATTITRSVILDTVAPAIGDVTLTPNPVDTGATYIISVTVTD